MEKFTAGLNAAKAKATAAATQARDAATTATSKATAAATQARDAATTATTPAAPPPTFEIPAKMKKLVVVERGATVKDCKIELQQDVDVPTPGPNEVLVKVIAAAVNPSDYGGWTKAEPMDAMGKEGAGIVVATGGGLITKRVKIGQSVGIINLKHNQGTYTEYVTASASDGVFPLPEDLCVEDAASFFVNPYTVLGIMDTAKSMGSKALVHTAAASQLGQMMVKIAADPKLTNGVEIINVVRRQEQVQLLQDLGAKHIVNSSDENWKTILQQKVEELQCTVAFDAVAGSTSGDILSTLPSGGILFVYGGLAGACSGISPLDLIYRKKQVKGFLMPDWIASGGVIMTVPRMMAAGRKVNAGLGKGGWAESQFKDITIDKVQEEVVKLLEGSATGIKLRIRFDDPEASL